MTHATGALPIDQLLPNRTDVLARLIARKQWLSRAETAQTVLEVVLGIVLAVTGGLYGATQTTEPAVDPPMWIFYIGSIVLAFAVVVCKHAVGRIRSILDSEMETLKQQLTRAEESKDTAVEAEQGAIQREKDALEKLQQFRVALWGALVPIAARLERMSRTSDHAKAQESLGQIKDAALQLLIRGLGDVKKDHTFRATIYSRDPNTGDPTRDIWAGRTETPRSRFEGDSLERIKVLMHRGDANCFYPNEDSNSVKPSRTSTYKVVVASSIGTDGQSFGMLTVDSSRKMQLGADDVPLVQAVGSILASAFQTADLKREIDELRQKLLALGERP
jgi:F0F1-type ATP synthase membrane subunit b/b'